MSAKAELAKGIGLAAFDSLHAEKEPWLDRCFILPPDFGLIAGGHSFLVVGSDGSGKTALFRALCAQLDTLPVDGTPPDRLVVYWHPRPVPPTLVGDKAAEAQFDTVLGAIADALLAYLAHWPHGFGGAPSDVRATLAWIVCHGLGSDVNRRLTYHLRGASPEGAQMLHDLPSQVVDDEWLPRASQGELAAELVKALSEVGPQTVCVLVDPDDLGDSPYLHRDLAAFLSSLALFENPNLIYKIIMADRLFLQIDQIMAVDRQRIRLALLQWEPEHLEEIVLRRVELATGRPVAGLADVCGYPRLGNWLRRTGGSSPRGWLETITPLVLRHLHLGRPVPAEQWRVVRQTPPPALRFEPATGVIKVGWRQITDMTDIPLALFTYLYKHKGERCSREELYYDAYLPAAQASPHMDDSWDHLIDSAMSRLRQEIEPDPREPLYVITERGFGYVLKNVL